MRKLCWVFPLLLATPAFASVCDHPNILIKPAHCRLSRMPKVDPLIPTRPSVMPIRLLPSSDPTDSLVSSVQKIPGLRIEHQIKGTIYEKIGLHREDIILSIDGTPIETGSLKTLHSFRQANGGEMTLKVYRASFPGRSKEMEIHLDTQGSGHNPISPRDKFSSSPGERNGRKITTGERDEVIGGVVEALEDYVRGWGSKEDGPRGGPIGVIDLPDRPSTPDRPEPETGPKTPDTDGPTIPDSPSEPEGPVPEEPTPEEPVPEEPKPEEPVPDEPKDDDDTGDDDGNDGGNDDGGEPTPNPDDDFMPGDPNGNVDDTGRGSIRPKRRTINPFRFEQNNPIMKWINPPRTPDALKFTPDHDGQNLRLPTIRQGPKPRLDPLINPVRGR